MTFANGEKFRLNGDHCKLTAVLQIPQNKNSYPLVIFMHGLTGDKEFPLLTKIADKLEESGIASIHFDFNGHGESEGDLQQMTIPNEIEDAKKIYEYVKNLKQVSSISFVGASQGGVVASMLAGELGANKIKNLVLLAPAGVIEDDVKNGELFSAKFDAENPPEYVEIFGNNRIGKNYIITAQNLNIYEISKKYTGNVLILHGTRDNIVPYSYSIKYSKIYKNSRLKLLDNFDHDFTQDTNKVASIVAGYLIETL